MHYSCAGIIIDPTSLCSNVHTLSAINIFNIIITLLISFSSQLVLATVLNSYSFYVWKYYGIDYWVSSHCHHSCSIVSYQNCLQCFSEMTCHFCALEDAYLFIAPCLQPGFLQFPPHGLGVQPSMRPDGKDCSESKY